MSSDIQKQAASLVSGYAQVFKRGRTCTTSRCTQSSRILTTGQETAGSTMRNKEWKALGQQEKEEARHDMQQASKDRDPAHDGFGNPAVAKILVA
jgi:hypothetical protein